MEKITTIKLTENTKNDLERFGSKNETFEDIVKKLIQEVRKYRLQSRQ